MFKCDKKMIPLAVCTSNEMEYTRHISKIILYLLHEMNYKINLHLNIKVRI